MKKITVLSEIRKEFSGLIEHFLVSISWFFTKYPRLIYSFMVLLMIGSLVLCFTLLRIKSKSAPIEESALLKVEGGLSEIGTTVGKLRKTLEVREALKVLLAKDTLSTRDSLLIVSMITELDHAVNAKK